MALGKGLREILEEVGLAYENELSTSSGLSDDKISELVREIDVDIIDPNPYQPRKHFDPERMAELSNSIREHGLLQPVVVIAKDDRYILVAGERRLRAHKIIELTKIRAIIADVNFDDLKMRELALVENIQRENLNAIELANSYQELLDVHSITHEELSRLVHKSRSQITNTIRLLSLSRYVQEMVIKEKITQGHAKILVGLDPKDEKVIVDTIIGQKLSVREAELLLKRRRSGTATVKKSKKTPFDPALVSRLENILPFKFALKSKKIEIVLPDKKSLIQFITLIEKVS